MLNTVSSEGIGVKNVALPLQVPGGRFGWEVLAGQTYPSGTVCPIYF